MRSYLTVAALAVLASASIAEAQSITPRQFRVAPRFGYMAFDRASSIEGSPYLGLQTDYGITSNLAVGFSFGISQPKTIGEDFITVLQFGDTARLFQVRHSLNVVDYGAHALLSLPEFGRISPYAVAGGGFYTIFLDPQIENAPTTYTKPQFTLGGGASVRVGERSRLLLDVRDAVFTGYERDELFAVTPSNSPFIEDLPAPHSTKSTLHNVVFSLGFSFTPRGRGQAAEGEEGSR